MKKSVLSLFVVALGFLAVVDANACNTSTIQSRTCTEAEGLCRMVGGRPGSCFVINFNGPTMGVYCSFNCGGPELVDENGFAIVQPIEENN